MAHVATGGKKWLKKPKSERNDIELVSFHYWTRLERQKRIKITKLWPLEDGPKVAARLILTQLVAILATFFEKRPPQLFCRSNQQSVSFNFFQRGSEWLCRR